MGYNDWCRHYLSPKQMALIHLQPSHKHERGINPKDITMLCGRSSFDHSISGGTETWSTDRYVKGDILYSPAQVKHTLQCSMAQDARIV